MKGDGGPAFPSGESYVTVDVVGNRTSNQRAPFYPGMSLRDAFALGALPVANNNFSPNPDETDEDWAHWLARTSYAVADAMLEERAKGKGAA